MQLAALPQLQSIDDYTPSTLTYYSRSQLEGRKEPTYPSLEDWIQIFRHSIASFQKLAASDPSISQDLREKQAAHFAACYAATLDEIEVKGRAVGHIFSAAGASCSGTPVTSCIDLCKLREQALRAAGFQDIFRSIKQKENEGALELLGEVLQEIDDIADPRQRWEAVVRGVFAGNIFDLGCAATTDMYHQDGISFHGTREKLLPRPWVIDCLEQLLDRLTTHTYHQAVLFVDNAGADVVLGMLPLARELLKRGTSVVVAANSLPSINDITAAELDAMLPLLCQADCTLCKGVSSGKLKVVASGNDLPVIDLTKLSTELVEVCQHADLIVLEGMGRSIETNLNALFTVDCLRVGMIKHPEVAAALGGRLYDCVCKFERGKA